MQTRMILVIGAVACILFFAAGIVIGHFAIEKKSDNKATGTEELLRTDCSNKFTEKWENYRQGYLKQCSSDSCMKATCNTEDLPRTYLAFHLNGKEINMDGKLDDQAWQEVPWTDSFLDIRGPDYPTPFFDTKVKVRWDDDRLYVGARMQETNFWGSYTEDESPVWRENAFEVYAVPDGSLHNYKEMQISVRNVSWDLMLKKAYMDFRECGDSQSVAVSSWDSDMRKGTYTDGIVNDPAGTGTFWSAEMSFSFDALANHTNRIRPTPDVQEAWFFIFARPQYASKIVNGVLVKNESVPAEWWSWQPMYTVNLHMPSRFGLVQFKRDLSDRIFSFPMWHIYRALFEIFEAEHKYKSVNSMFIDDLTQLHMAPKILSSECVSVSISLNDTDFIGSVTSRLDPNLQTGHIRSDRYVWFT